MNVQQYKPNNINALHWSGFSDLEQNSQEINRNPKSKESQASVLQPLTSNGEAGSDRPKPKHRHTSLEACMQARPRAKHHVTPDENSNQSGNFREQIQARPAQDAE